MIQINDRTAQLAYVALSAAVRQAKPKLNGRELPDDVSRALWELAFAVAGSPERTTVDSSPAMVRPCEQIDAVTAASRLGITVRAVQKRCAEGKLQARRIGRTWLIEWTTGGAPGADHLELDHTSRQPSA